MTGKSGLKPLYHGVVLILLGIFLYWQHQKLAQWGWGIFWPLLPLALGLLFFLEYRRTGEKGLVIAGIILAGAGGFFLLFTLGYLAWSRMAELWPFFLFLAGLAFLLAYCSDFSDQGLLLPVLLFCAAGLLGLGRNIPAVCKDLCLHRQALLIVVAALFLITGFRTRRGRTD